VKSWRIKINENNLLILRHIGPELPNENTLFTELIRLRDRPIGTAKSGLGTLGVGVYSKSNYKATMPRFSIMVDESR